MPGAFGNTEGVPIQRMIQAGAHPVTAISFGSELMRNWAWPDSDNLRTVLRWYFPARRELAYRSSD